MKKPDTPEALDDAPTTRPTAPESLNVPHPLEVKTWGGLPNYACPLCGFASLELAQATHRARNCETCNKGDE